MNFKLKCLRAVGVIGLSFSAVHASAGLPENPEDRTITQELQVAINRGDTVQVVPLAVRVDNICKALGMPHGTDYQFLGEFYNNASHRYNERTVSDGDLRALVRDYWRNGEITIRKPLEFSNDRSLVPSQTSSTVILFERAKRVCRNPGVPEELLMRAVRAVMMTHTHMSDDQLADAIDSAL